MNLQNFAGISRLFLHRIQELLLHGLFVRMMITKLARKPQRWFCRRRNTKVVCLAARRDKGNSRNFKIFLRSKRTPGGFPNGQPQTWKPPLAALCINRL